MSKQVEVEFEVTAERLPIVDTIQPELIPVSAGCPSNPMDDLTSFAEASSRFASVSDWNAAMDGLSALDYSGYDEEIELDTSVPIRTGHGRSRRTASLDSANST